MPDNASMNLRDIAARRKAVLDREEARYKEMTAEYNREYHEKVREFTPSKTVKTAPLRIDKNSVL
jgi:hypothetical protein